MRWHCAWRVSRAWQATTDGHGLWRWPDRRQLAFLLELDDPPRVGVAQLRKRIASIPDPSLPVTVPEGFPDSVVTLIWCATLRREQILRRAITTHLSASRGMPLALTCAEYAGRVPGAAHGRVWIPFGALPHHPAGRLTLVEVADAVSGDRDRTHCNSMHAHDDLILNDFDIGIV